MKKLKLLSLLFYSSFLFAQQNNPEIIYKAIDALVAKPCAQNIQKLTEIEQGLEKNNQNNSPETQLALVILNCNKAYYQNHYNQNLQAINSYEKAAEKWHKKQFKNYDIIEYCLKPLGNLYCQLGNYDGAENTIKQYLYLAESQKNKEHKIAAILNLCNVYQSSGKIEESVQLLEKSLASQKLTNTQKGIFYNNLGASYLLSKQKYSDNLYEAETAFLKGIQHLQKKNQNQEVLSNAYQNLAALYVQKKQFDKATKYLELAKNCIANNQKTSKQPTAKLYLQEALLFYNQQKLEEASTTIYKVFATIVPNYSVTTKKIPEQKMLFADTVLLDALDLQATIFAQQNQLQKALTTYQRAFYIDEIFASLLQHENSELVLQTRVRARTEKCLAIYAQLYQQDANQNHWIAAFQLSERTKSGVLKKSIWKNKNASLQEKKYAAAIQNWNTIVLKEQQKGNLASIATINHALQQQSKMVLLLQEAVTKDQGYSLKNINLPQLFKKLQKDNATMIHYFSGQSKLYYFILNNNKLAFYSSKNSDNLMQNVQQFIAFFESPNTIANQPKKYMQIAKKVYELLHIPKTEKQTKLLIIPDGLLCFLPFDALITKNTNTTNFSKMNFLLHDYTILYANSVQFYLDKNKQQNNKTRVLGVFPIFKNTPNYLAFSEIEMQAIQSKFTGIYFKNNEATFQNFKKNALKSSILHLSTHANAGTIDIPASIKFTDQEVLYSELYSLKLNSDLVVLSACETGIGKLYKSEGAMSIARGFQQAGVQNNILSLWKVNDYTTSEIMTNFYGNLAANYNYCDALHLAKQSFLQNSKISNSKKSPYYWSAFVYYGSAAEKSTYTIWYISTLVLIVLGIFYIYLKKR